jgi:hypothetical protein
MFLDVVPVWIREEIRKKSSRNRILGVKKHRIPDQEHWKRLASAASIFLVMPRAAEQHFPHMEQKFYCG